MGEDGGRGVAVAAAFTPRVILLSGGSGGSSISMEEYGMSGSIVIAYCH